MYVQLQLYVRLEIACGVRCDRDRGKSRTDLIYVDKFNHLAMPNKCGLAIDDKVNDEDDSVHGVVPRLGRPSGLPECLVQFS